RLRDNAGAGESRAVEHDHGATRPQHLLCQWFTPSVRGGALCGLERASENRWSFGFALEIVTKCRGLGLRADDEYAITSLALRPTGTADSDAQQVPHHHHRGGAEYNETRKQRVTGNELHGRDAECGGSGSCQR